MIKKIIYTQRVDYIESYSETRDSADRRIPQFLFECGYLPIPVPNDKNIVQKIIESINPMGIVLVGGNSLVKYGGDSLEKDEVDAFLVEYAIQNGIPLFGFCRGMQSILDYFGCKLMCIKDHVAVRHLVDYQGDKIEVNSFHNQACVELAENSGLMVIGISQDGIIEAIEHTQYPIKAVMWHPEREKRFTDLDKSIIIELFG